MRTEGQITGWTDRQTAKSKTICLPEISILGDIIRHVKKKLFVILVVLAACLELVLIPLLVKWFLPRHSEKMFCFNNEKIVKGNPEWVEHLKSKKGETVIDGQNCVEASKAIDAIVSKMTETRYNRDANPEHNISNLTMFNCEIEDRNILIIRLKGASFKAGESLKIFWKADIMFGSDVQYLDEEGAIFIKKSGHYFINVQLTIRMNVGSCSDNIDKLVKLQVIHVPVKQKSGLVIIENVHSVCEIPNEQSEQSINVGAAFKLKENEKIYVAFSHPNLLSTGHGRDHFSIHAI